MKDSHAVYVVDGLPEGGEDVPAGFPAYADHEMLAGAGPLAAVVDGQLVPLVDPLPFWDVSVRVHRTVTRAQLVAGLLALAGALEAGKMPAPIQAAEQPCGQFLTVTPDAAGE